MVFQSREDAVRYTPQDGDTLASIAERERANGNDITAEDIARFNWGTDDPDTIDEFLRDELGCYRRGEDRHFVISADVDARSDLLIPQRYSRDDLATNRTHVLHVRRTEEPPTQFETCARIPGVCFEFDKSFIRPEVVHELENVQRAVDENPEAKILVFGHTDPVGTDQYNKALSVRRALSAYAFITNNVDVWLDLHEAENWGLKPAQAILKDMDEPRYDPGAVDGVDGTKTRTAVRNYQEDKGLEVDGVVGPNTRRALFEDYMSGKHDIEIDDERFMDPKFMGCGEYNPIVTFTEDEQREMEQDHELRNRRNEPNRRVTFYLFNPDRLPRVFCERHTNESNCERKATPAQVQPTLTPCDRFGVNEELGSDRPRHHESFGCAWYDSIAFKCACDQPGNLPTPFPEVWFAVLDPWFIPETEPCEIQYGLNGVAEQADKVELEVYVAGYYGSAEVDENGVATWTEVENKLIFKPEAPLPNNQPGQTHTYRDWKGESNAAEGVLKPREGGERHVNVALSPYTVHLRYLEQGAGDTAARIDLKPFWVQFEETRATPAATPTVSPGSIRIAWTNAEAVDRAVVEVKDRNHQRVYLAEMPAAQCAAGAQSHDWDKIYRDGVENTHFAAGYLDDSGEATPENAPYTYTVTTLKYTPKADSLKVNWSMIEPGQLTVGKIEISDGRGTLVQEAELGAADLAEGDHEFVWDGSFKDGATNSKGDAEPIREDMPYRVQVRAHTDQSVDAGAAIAAMHTEVRLYVHPETRAPKDPAYADWTARQSLALALAPLVPGDPPDEGDGTTWFRYQLARLGFHPGPVTAASDADDIYEIALKDFRRSVPADGSASGTNFTRLRLDGPRDHAEDDTTRQAINTIRETDHRRWFGSHARVRARNDNPDLSDEEIATQLAEVDRDIVLWVDDRHVYTDPSLSRDETNNFYSVGTPAATTFGLKNYRGDMDIRDNRVTKDDESIARPWIPLQVDLPLLSRTKKLTDTAEWPDDEDQRGAMRRAIGPLRVDWTFDELPYDVSTIDATSYDKEFSRSRYYTAWAIRQHLSTHSRADTGRTHPYTNCKATLGGIRPNSLGSYYKAAFGLGNLKLEPWTPIDVSADEAIATIVHDDLDPNQTAGDTLYEARRGAAGIYFNPSRIAGDGYRLRAETRFATCGDYDFPNLAHLAPRYPTPPQAHSARIRLWRRSSIRGYMCWKDPATGHWPGHIDTFREQYSWGHVYMVHEADTPMEFAIGDVYDPSDAASVDRFKKIVRNNVVKAQLKDMTKMSLKSEHIWPWSDQDDFGYPFESPVNIDPGDVYDDYLDDEIADDTWRKFRKGLLMSLLREVEKRGHLRGHLLVEFLSSGRCYCEEYECEGGDSPKHRYWYIRKHGVAHGGNNGNPCPFAHCGNTLDATGRRRTFSRLPLAAVGAELGATWLYSTSPAHTWVHETGHHRHFEHADNAPGGEFASSSPSPGQRMHDNQDNTRPPDWSAVDKATHASQRDWDRHCTMSYVKTVDRHWCGKCILRNRGWKVQTLGFPGTDKTEP